MNATRAFTIAVPAAIVAIIGVVLLSPLGPVGLARRLEFGTGMRVSPTVLFVTAVAVVLALTALGAATTVGSGRRRIRLRPTRVTTARSAIGPVAAVGATVVRLVDPRRGRDDGGGAGRMHRSRRVGHQLRRARRAPRALRRLAEVDVAVGHYSEPAVPGGGGASLRDDRRPCGDGATQTKPRPCGSTVGRHG